MSARAASFGVVIPARYGSTRLPGKPLLDLAGKPMVVRVLEVAARAGAAFTIVATDDRRIAEAVERAGGEVMLTRADHATGTDRLAEVVERKKLDPELVLVNLQGDEPALPAEHVALVARTLQATTGASLATLATPIRQRWEIFDPNVVKVVTGQGGQALYFSRAPIPWRRGDFTLLPSSVHGPLPPGPFLRHVGVYAYRASTLLTLSRAQPIPLEEAEGLEQLRALWLGLTIQVALVDALPAGGVDTAEDAQRVRELFRE